MSKLRIIELEQQLAEATARADDAEGINLAVTEQMKIIASFTDNTASVNIKFIHKYLDSHWPNSVEDIRFCNFNGSIIAFSAYVMALSNLREYAKSLGDGEL